MAKRRSSSPKQSQDQEQKQEGLPDVSPTDLQDASLDGVSANYGNQAAAELLGVPTEDVQKLGSVDLAPDKGGEGEGEDGTEDLGGFQAKVKEDAGGGEGDDKPDEGGGGGGGGGASAGGGGGDEEDGGGEGDGEGKESKGGGGGGGEGGGGEGDEEGGGDDGLGGMKPEEVMLKAKQSTGNIMSEAVHDKFKKFLGHDFGHVRVHYDKPALDLLKELKTDAVTIGSDVFVKEMTNSPKINVLMAEQLNYVMQDDVHLARKSTTGSLQMARLNEKNMMDGRLVGLDAVRKANKMGQKGGGKDGKLREEMNPLRTMGGDKKDMKYSPKPIEPNAVIFPSQSLSKPKLARSIDPTGGKRLNDVGMNMGGVGDKLGKMLGEGGGKLDNSLEGLSTKGMFKLGMQVFGEEMQDMPKEMLASQAVKIAQSANPGSLPYKKELEAEFGVNLDNVKVFFGGRAKEACQMVQARAFAVKNVVVFADASPSKDVVKHEITHVVQQGGHKKGNKLSGVPDKMAMSKPSDKEEHEAENVASDRGSGHSVKEGGSGDGVSRILDISVTQEEVMSAVVDNVMPDGYGANIGSYIAQGDGIQGVLDGVQGSINMSSAFPISNISTLFGGDAFDYLDPNAFMESIKPSGDTIVEEFATGVMGFCDATLAVLDGLLGTITGILDLVETIVSLLENASKVLNIVAAAIAAIAAALAATLFGAGAAAVLFNIAAQCRNVASAISNITKVVRGFLDPIMAVVDVLETVRDTVQQIRDIAEIVKMACDVYDWLTADTAEDRAAASTDLAGSVGSMSNVLGMFTGGIYGDFATTFWGNAQPFVVGQLQGAHGGAETGVGGEQSQTSLDNSFSVSPHADIPGGITQHGTDSLVQSDKAAKPDEAVSSYKQISAEEKAKNPPKEDDPEPPDLSRQVRSDTQSKASGQQPAGDPGAAASPGTSAKGANPGSQGSIVSGATGLVASVANMGLGGDVMQNMAVATGAKMLEDQGYHGNVDELFDYINNVMIEKETAESLDTQGAQRKQEAVALEQDADEAIVAMEESKKVSEAQEESTKANEKAGHEGVGFMDYIMNLSQTLQQKLEEKINEAFGVNKDSDEAGNKGLMSSLGAEGEAKKGQSKGGGALGIIKRVSAAALKAVLGKILEKIDVGKILQKIIPGDLGNIFEMVTQFIGMATGSKDQAKAKEDEAKGAQGVLNTQIAQDRASQSESQTNQATADSTIAEAQRTKAAAIKAQQDADQQKAEANQLRSDLDQEQARLEASAQGKMNEAGPLRPRNQVEQVDVPGGYSDLGTFPSAGDIGEMPGANAQLTISSDRGNPDAVAGANRSTSMGMSTQTPWSDSGAQEPQSSQLATRQDASRGTDGTDGTSDVSAILPGGSGSFTPTEAFAGAPTVDSDAALDGPTGGLDLVTRRELDDDIAQLDAVTEARRPDPNIPPSIEEQVADIQTPVVEGAADQENERFDKLTTTYEAIPEVETLYDTLEQLPEPASDNTAYTQLRPMSTGGLGYNSQHVIIDSDVSQVRGWGGALPTDSHLTDPPAHGPLGEQPHYIAPTPLAVPQTKKTQMPSLELPQIDQVVAPFEPTTSAMRDNPPALANANDVMGSVVMQAALSDSMENAGQIVDQHESEEQTLVSQAQTEVVEIQVSHESQAGEAWTQRDLTLRETRQQWVQQQQQTVDTHEQELGSTETELYDQAETQMHSGLRNADGSLREGEQQAFSIEQKADQDSQQLNSDAQQKAATLWGWFRQHVAEFTSHITDMVHGLWSQASGAIHNVLHGAETFAKETISSARTATANTLAALSQQMNSLYGSMKSQLSELGQSATSTIVQAVEAAYATVQRVADQAANAAAALMGRVDAAIQSLVDRTQAALEAEWAEFDLAAEEVRAGRAEYPGAVDGSDELTEGDTGLDTTPGSVDLSGQQVQSPSDLQTGSDDASARSDQVAGGGGGSALAGTEAQEVVGGWVDSTVSDRAENWSQLSSVTDGAEVSHDTAYRQALQPLPEQLAGEGQLFDGTVQVAGPSSRQLTAPEDGSMGDLGMANIEQPDLSGLNPSRALNLPPIDIDNPDLVPRANEVAGDLNSIQVSNPGIQTSPGPTPSIPLVGPTDPQNLDRSAIEGLEQGFDAGIEAREALEASPAPEVIVPIHLDEVREVDPLQPFTTGGQTESIPDMQKWIDTGMETPWRPEADGFYGAEHQEALDPVKVDVIETTRQRDEQRQQLMEDAHVDADTFNAEVQQEQLDVVAQERQAVADARADARRQQDDGLTELRDEVARDHARVRQEVDNRARTDQQRVNDAFAKAERDAEAEVAAAEREAEAEKRRAEEDANDRSWWERAGDWVKSQIDSVKQVVNGIFEAVRDTVRDLIDTVRSFAEDVIQQAFDFIRQSIQDFAETVRNAVEYVVDDLLPAIAEELRGLVTAAIDLATEFVLEAKRRVTEFVEELVDTLTTALDRLVTWFADGLQLLWDKATWALQELWANMPELLLEIALLPVNIALAPFNAMLEALKAAGIISTPSDQGSAGAPTTAQMPTQDQPFNQEALPAVDGRPAREIVPAGFDGVAPGESASYSQRPTDGMVDFYMEENWNREVWDSAAREMALDQHLQTAIDRFLPEEMDGTARNVANFAWNMGVNVFDAAITGMIKAIPGVGAIYMTAEAVKDIGSHIKTYGELEDGTLLGLQLIRTGADWLGNVAKNVGDLIGLIEVILAATGIGALPAAAVAVINEVFAVTGLVTDSIKVGCDAGIFLHSAMMVDTMQRQGDFEKAKKYQGFAQGAVVDGIFDTIDLIGSVTDVVALGTVPTGAAGAVTDGLSNMGKRVVGESDGIVQQMTKGIDTSDAAIGDFSIDVVQTLAGRAAGGAPAGVSKKGGVAKIVELLGGGLMEGGYVDPGEVDITTAGQEEIGGAREESAAFFEALYASLAGDHPRFHQGAINKAISGDNKDWLETYDAMLKPSTYAAGFADLLIGMPSRIDDAGGAAILDGIAGAMDWAARPVLEKINEMIVEWKPGLDELLLNVTQAIADQEVSLQFARDAVTNVDEFMDFIEGIGDDEGMLDRTFQGVAASMESAKLTAETFGIPDWVPAFLYMPAFMAWNAHIDLQIMGVNWVNDSMRPMLDEFVGAQTAKAQEHLAQIQEVIAEGSTAEQLLQGAHEVLSDGMVRFAEAVDNWDPQLATNGVSMALDWLREEGRKQRQEAVDNRAERFRAWAATYGQGQVDAWKGAHEEEVRQGYMPEVPAWEIAAVETTYAMIVERHALLETEAALYQPHADSYLESATESYAACQSAAGSTGRDNLENFWLHADRIADCAKGVGL